MKRSALLATTALLCTAATAQTLNLYQGAVTTVFSAEQAGAMTYTDGTTLTIGSKAYNVSEIDSIVFDQSATDTVLVTVTYSASGATVVLSGDMAPYITASVSGADVSITADSALTHEVNYVLQGSSSNGSFTLHGSYKSTVTLAGLNLTSTTGAAINIDNGKRIAVIVADGTENNLADGAAGTQDACFYVKGHPEFSGGGTLNLTGNATHAFKSKEYTELKASFGTLNVLSAANDGLHVGQYFKQKGGSVVIANAKGDGIDVGITNDVTDEQNGQVLISGGSINVALGATQDVKGIKCDSAMTISGGAITVTGSGDGEKGMKIGTNLYVNDDSGSAPTLNITVSGTTYAKGTVDESKTRGIKVDGNFTFDGGTIAVSATGTKGKAIVVDGTYTYVSGSINCSVDAATTA